MESKDQMELLGFLSSGNHTGELSALSHDHCSSSSNGTLEAIPTNAHIMTLHKHFGAWRLQAMG